MQIPTGKKIYFASDSHFGIPSDTESLKREKLMVQWLDQASNDAAAIYLLGDIFDFWFEYKTVVPKGFVRLFGKLASLTDDGVPVYFFTGNHDLWAFDYLEKELGLEVFRQAVEREYNGKFFFIGHGDGLGPGDRGYKFMKKMFSFRFNQRLFSFLHPGLGTGIGMYLSKKSRIANHKADEDYRGEKAERLIRFCQDMLKTRKFDYFIFGHRHLPLDIPLGENSRYINTGDWITHFSYAVFDGNDLFLKRFVENENQSE